MGEQNTAVVLFFYNRPNPLRRVLERILHAEPRALYLVSDGPKNKADESDVGACRAIADAVPYPFPVHRKYADRNLGVARSIPEGLDWVFAQETKAIILEDDVLPEPAFFPFMKEMLKKYRADERIDLILGHQLAEVPLSAHQYFFTRFCLPPWGWATWADAWSTYDYGMKAWPACRERLRKPIGVDLSFWSPILDRNQATPRSWDIQWNFWLWARQTMAVAPAQSLTTNIGFGSKATFTRKADSLFAKQASASTDPINWTLAKNADALPFEQLLQERLQALIVEVMSGQGRSLLDE